MKTIPISRVENDARFLYKNSNVIFDGEEITNEEAVSRLFIADLTGCDYIICYGLNPIEVYTKTKI